MWIMPMISEWRQGLQTINCYKFSTSFYELLQLNVFICCFVKSLFELKCYNSFSHFFLWTLYCLCVLPSSFFEILKTRSYLVAIASFTALTKHKVLQLNRSGNTCRENGQVTFQVRTLLRPIVVREDNWKREVGTEQSLASDRWIIKWKM